MRRTALALGAALSAWGGTAAAQQQPQIPNVTNKRDWQLEGRVGVVYDSNVARGSEAVALARGISRDEVTVTPSVQANIVQPFGKQALFLDGLAGYDFNKNNPKLDSQRYQISGGGVGVVGPCRPSVTGAYRESQSDLADLNLISSTNRQKAESVFAAVGCGRPVGINGTVSVGRINVMNSAPQVKLSDYTTETVSAAVSYLAPSVVNASIFYSYNSNEYPNRVNPGRPVGDGFFTQALGLRLEREFGSRISASGGIGRTRLKREFAPAGTPQKVSSTTYDAILNYRIGQRIDLNITGARGITPSNRPGKLYDIAETLQGQASYKLGRRINISVGHIYSDVSSNVDTLLVGFVVTSSRTNTTFGRIDLTKIGPGSLSFDVRHERRNTNLPSFDYSATRVGLNTAVSF